MYVCVYMYVCVCVCVCFSCAMRTELLCDPRIYLDPLTRDATTHTITYLYTNEHEHTHAHRPSTKTVCSSFEGAKIPS